MWFFLLCVLCYYVVKNHLDSPYHRYARCEKKGNHKENTEYFRKKSCALCAVSVPSFVVFFSEAIDFRSGTASYPTHQVANPVHRSGRGRREINDVYLDVCSFQKTKTHRYEIFRPLGHTRLPAGKFLLYFYLNFPNAVF